jgi:hypothetical protein
MAKNFPVISCVNCGFEWRRYAKRKLLPSRNCPKCYNYLKIEGTDYVWISRGNFGDKNLASPNTSKVKKVEIKNDSPKTPPKRNLPQQVEDSLSSEDIALLEL